MEGFINLNKLLFNEYGYNYNNDILSQNFIEVELKGKREKFWFKYKGELYLYKKQAPGTCDLYGELLADSIANLFGIQTAMHHPATFNNEIGIISKNFLKDNEKLVPCSEIIINVLDEHLFFDLEFRKKYNIEGLNQKDIYNKLNNLEDIWSIFELYFSYNKDKENIKIIMNELLKRLFFDMITIQGDRNIDNWGIITTKDNNFIKVAPLYDNPNILGLNRKGVIKPLNGMIKSLDKNNSNNKKTFENIKRILYHPKLVFSTSEDDIINIEHKKRKNNLSVLDNFLKITVREQIHLLESYLDIIDNYGIKNIIDDCEKQYNIKIPNDIKEYCFNALFVNCLLIREKVDNYLYGGEYQDARKK